MYPYPLSCLDYASIPWNPWNPCPFVVCLLFVCPALPCPALCVCCLLFIVCLLFVVCLLGPLGPFWPWAQISGPILALGHFPIVALLPIVA